MIDNQWWEQRWFLYLLVLLSTVPLLYPSVPVWGDMPAHLAMYRVALEHSDPTSPLNHFFQFTWKIQGNMGVEVLVMLLSSLFPLELAAKLVLILTIALTTFGILALSKEVHGRVSSMALFSVPLAYSFTFQFGMANYCLSMSLAICGFTFWLKWGQLGWWRLRALVFLAGSPLLWMCHIYGWAVLCVMCSMTELGQNLQRGDTKVVALWRTILACIVLAFPLALTMIWRSGGSGFASGWFDVEEKISFMMHSLSAIWPMGNFKSISVKIALLLTLALVMVRQRRCILHPKMRLAVATLMLLFLGLPLTLFGSYAADGRLFPYIIIFGLLSLDLAGQADERLRSWFAWGGLGFTVVQVAAITISFAGTAEAQERRMRVLANLPVGARLVSFIGGGQYCEDHEYNRVMNHLPSMALVRRRAFANDQFQNDQLMRVIYPPETRGGQSQPNTETRDYYHDESQLVMNPTCRRGAIDTALVGLWGHTTSRARNSEPQNPHAIEYTLRHLPRGKFDYVWLIAPPPFNQALLHGLTRVAGEGDSVLYIIDD